MLLVPQRRKFRKIAIGRLSGASSNGTEVAFGTFGMKAVSNGFLTSRQIEAARKVIVRYVRKTGKVWIRIFPDVPVTKKPLEVKMGWGKGNVDHYMARIKRGRVLFEINGVDAETAKDIFKKASYKLPLQTRTIERGEVN